MTSQQDWRDKYLALLHENDELEKRLSQQATILRRSVINLSSLVTGLDAEVDKAVNRFKQALLNNSKDAVSSELEALEQTISAYEANKSKESESDHLEQARVCMLEIHKLIPPSLEVGEAMENLRNNLVPPTKPPQLPKALAQLRFILLRKYLAGDSETNRYLNKVSAELNEIGLRLQEIVRDEDLGLEVSSAFEQSISDHMEELHSSVENATTLDTLKSAVKIQLSSIQGALKKFKQESKKGSSLAEQLKALVARVESVEDESQKVKDQLEEERYRATHDELTALPNRVAYRERVAQEWRRFQRYQRPLCIAVGDIDHFKSFNDTYGHQAGDQVLSVIAGSLKERIREVDFVARYGGEEFVILLPETELSDAATLLNNLRESIANRKVTADDSQVLSITMSFGVTEFELEDTIVTAFERADKALYKAKAEGRNRCCFL